LPVLGSLAAAVPVAQAAPELQAAAVRLSQGDRYRQMCRSVNDRLCTGKSAIHGLGVFTKRAHKAGVWTVGTKLTASLLAVLTVVMLSHAPASLH
jgi:hypothetical protein